MKKLLLILFILISILSNAQDISPLPSVTVKKLIAPNTPVFYYNTVDSAFWVFKGETGWLRLATNEQLKKYYVPYIGASKTVDLGNQLITSKKQLLPLFNGACTIPTILDNGNGTITVGDGEYHLSTRTDGKGTQSYVITGGIFSLTDNTTNYLVADYNSGTPILKVITDVNLINETTVVPVYTAYRTGNTLHFQNWDALGVALANKVHQSIVKTQRYRRESGLGISEVATRYLSVGNGRVWVGAVPVTIDAVTTNTDNLRLYYHSGGVWTLSLQTQYNNTQYDNGTDLVTLTANRYAVNWIFRGVESQKHLYVVLGRGDYTLAQAQEAVLPAIPAIISSHAVLIGKLIVQRDATTATSIQSAFDVQFATATPNAHNDLTGRDVSDVHPAGSITFTPIGTYTATTVADALAQIDSKTVDRSITNEIQAPTRVGDLIGLTQTITTISIADKEPVFSKNTAFNKNFGTTAGTVLEGRIFGTAANNNTGDFIQNQNSSPQNARSWINDKLNIGYTNGLGTAKLDISTSNANINGILISNWYGGITNYGPKIGFDNSTQGYWTIGSGNGRNTFEIERYGGFIDFSIDGTGSATFASTIQATTAKLTNLTDGYIPYHISDASGLDNSVLKQTAGSLLLLGGTYKGSYFEHYKISSLDTTTPTQLIFAQTASNDWSIQSVEQGIAYRNITLNPTAGNVGIGYSTGTEITNNKLAVNGNIFANGQINTTNYVLNGNNLFSSLSPNTIAKWDGTKFVNAATNASGFLKNDGSGNFSYTYPEITDIKATGSTFGYVPTSNGSGGLEMRSPVLSVTSFIKQKSPTGIFNLAHSGVVYNNMLFVGERASNPKIVRFSNVNDLSIYSSITVSGVGSAGAGLETGFYVSSIGKVCFIGRNNTAGFDIIEVDPNTMAYTQHNFASITGLSGIGGTDGTHIYYSNYSTMYKIRVSDWTVVASNPLPANLQWPHSMSVNPARGEFYMTGSIIDPIYMIKVNTSDLSYTQINLSSYITHATDDMCFYDNGTVCKVFVGGEQFYGTEPYCGVVVETTNANALSAIHIKPSYGLFIDGVKIYSCSLDGYIQTFSALDPTNVSTFPLDGYSPNEVLTTSTGRTFLTHWNTTQSVMAEFYVPIPMPDPSSAVTSVFGRTGAVAAVSGDYSASQVTNAADKSTANTFADNITISKNISPYFEVVNTGASTTGGGFRVSDESGFYRGTWGYNNNTNETYFFNQFDDPYKYILNNVEQYRMKTDGVFETRNLSSAPTAARSGFGGFYTKNNLPYFINSSGTETQLGSASGSMVYPSGSGIPIVSGGVAWGTTISIPGNTTQYLRADGTFATPTFTSQWTTDTYGITYANNVGIGVASGQFVKQTVLSNVSGYPVFAGQNTNANGHGAYIYGGSTSSDYTLRLYNYSGGSELFNVRGNGDIYAPNLQSGTTSYAVYYNDVTKRLTWGAAGGGGGSGTVTNFSSGNLSPLFTTSVVNATTTPALSFTAVNQASNLVFASPNGSTGVPSFRKVVVGDISASGTPSVGTFLQGNGTWETTGWAKDTYGYSSASNYIGIGTASTNFIALSVSSPVAGAWIKSGNSGMYALSIQANANTSGTPLLDMTNGSGATVGSVDATGDMKLNGSIKIGNETDAASASNVGTIRYRSDSNNSYCEMVMQTGASTYAWVIIKQNSW